MGVYGDIEIKIGDKRYNFDDDFGLMCVKTMHKVARYYLNFYDYVKESYLLQSYQGEEVDLNSDYIATGYINELDKDKWFNEFELEDDANDYIQRVYGMFLVLSKIPEVRIFFRSEFSDCLGYFDSNATKEWLEEGRVKLY